MNNCCLKTKEPTFINITFPGSYPYTVVAPDEAIIVNTSQIQTINLILSPKKGMHFLIKDGTGSAGSNPITIQGNSNNIDGNPQYIMATNFGFVKFLFNGTQWNIINQ